MRKRFHLILHTSIMLFSCSILAQEFKLLKLTHLGGDLILNHENVDETQSKSGSDTYSFENTLTQYGLGVDLEGYIYHPNLLHFTIKGDYYLDSIETKTLNSVEDSNADKNSYNIQFELFRKKKINAVFFAMDNESTSTRKFSGRYYNRSKVLGTSIKAHTHFMPFELSYTTNNLVSKTTSTIERNETDDEIGLQVKLYNKNNINSKMNFKHNSYTESINNISYKTTDFNAILDYSFGENSKNKIYTYLLSNKLSGDIDITNIQILSNYYNKIKKNLHFNTRFQLLANSFEGNSIKSYEISSYLSHQLYASLTSKLSASLLREQSDFDSKNNSEIDGNISYNKKIPSGSLHASFIQNYKHHNVSSEIETGFRQETYSFNQTDIISLNMINIDINSIQITSNDLNTLYIEGVDYILQPSGSLLFITRIDGGNIPENSEIRILFNYTTYPDYTNNVHLYSNNFSIKLFHLLTLYYNSTYLKNGLTSDFFLDGFEDFSQFRKGIMFNSKYIVAHLSSENYLSNIESYKRNYTSFTFRKIFDNSVSMIYNYSKNETSFINSILNNSYISESLSLSYSIFGNLNTEVIARKYNFQTLSNDNLRKSIVFKLKWMYRKITLDLFYEHVLNEVSANSDMVHDMFTVNMRRRF